MLLYAIFALAVFSTCSGEDPSLKTLLLNELNHLDELMTSIEDRIQAVAKSEIGALTNSAITCWALHLAGFKNDIEKYYNSNLAGIRGEIQTNLDKVNTMNQTELDRLENALVDSSASSLTTRLSGGIQRFIQEATNTIQELNSAKSFTCTS